MICKVYNKVCSNRLYFILFIVVLTVLSSFNIFHSGIIYGDDINFHMYRIFGIVDNIKIGKYVPVYFNYLKGFGYGNGLFYPDLFLFIPAVLNYLGLNIIISLKIFIFIINFFSIYFMYLCVYRISGEKKCAYASMILYAISGYRLIDFVARGALGEMIAFVFLPLVVLGLYEIFFGDYEHGYFLTIGLSCLCFSHVISFYLMCFFVILFIFINMKCLDKTRLKYLIIYILLAMLITVHFWLPMLEQIVSDKFNFAINSKVFENIVPFNLLFFDLPFNGNLEYFPVGVGLAYYVFIFKYFRMLKKDNFIFIILCFGLISILFCFVDVFWKINVFYKVFSVIQFPWRFYMFASFFFILVVSLFIKNVHFNKLIKLLFVYLLVVFIVNISMYSINVYVNEPKKNEIMVGEYLPEGFNLNIVDDYFNDDILYERKNNVLSVSIIKKDDYVEVPLIYYKGYVACGDRCYETFKTDNGLVGIYVDSDVENLDVYYYGTRIYNFTKFVSVLGIFVLIYIIKKYH